jgi:hypothetical protein
MNIAVKFIFAFVLTGLAAVVSARPTSSGEFRIARGHPSLDGKAIPLSPRSDGSQPVVGEERLGGDQSDLALLSFWDRRDGATESTIAFVVLRFESTGVVISNTVNSGLDFVWGDNNYSRMDGGTLYFGVFSPSRKQFAYRDGKLEEYKGPWMGPAKPEKYIEPDKSLPCANVANVPECLAEVERTKARKSGTRSVGIRPANSASAASR